MCLCKQRCLWSPAEAIRFPTARVTVVVSHQPWVLGTKGESSGGTASSLKFWLPSPVLLNTAFKVTILFCSTRAGLPIPLSYSGFRPMPTPMTILPSKDSSSSAHCKHARLLNGPGSHVLARFPEDLCTIPSGKHHPMYSCEPFPCLHQTWAAVPFSWGLFLWLCKDMVFIIFTFWKFPLPRWCIYITRKYV